MTIDEKKLLKDILDSIESIDEHLENKRVFSEYLQSKTKRRAVQRELEIIGEAVNRLLNLTQLLKSALLELLQT